uniref:Variant surface glycoprotein 1125.1645 n=1 Tax=Trypanosoma brucei TaxID=5691 RepID=A0A1J0R7F7_9TRYP|nr:variant surface glycoprotein 1125.1645 [Trypanosoma brucei]
MIFKRSGYPSAERLKAVALTAAVISLATRTAQTTGVEPASKKVNNPCRKRKYTKHLAEHILRNSDPPQAQLTNLHTYAEAWELLAHSQTMIKLRAATYALAAKATNEHTAAGATAMKKRKAATEAADILTKRSQAAKRLLGMALELKKGTASKDTPEVGGNNPDKVCELTFSPVMTGAAACMEAPTATTEPESVPVELNAKTKIKMLKATDLRPRPIKVAAEAKGTITNIDGADGYGCRQGSDENNHFIRLISKGKASEATATTTDVAIDKLSGGAAGCGTPTGEETKTELDTKLLGHKICEYINAVTAAVTDPTAWDPDTLASDNTIKAAYTTYLKAADEKPKEGEELQEDIKSVLGSNKDCFSERFIQKLTNTQVEYADGETSKSEPILKLLKAGHGLKALIHLSAHNSRLMKTEPTVKSTKETETDETCAAKGTGDNCKDGCKVEGKGDKAKCVVDPNYTAKQEEGGEKTKKKQESHTPQEAILLSFTRRLICLHFF